MSSETKVGFFSILGLLLLGLSVYLLGSFSFSKGYPINVQFTDVSGLPKKSSVRLNGVEVGKVKEIKIEGDNVVVVISIHEGVEIYRGSTFKIAATSLIGSKYLRIDQGSVRTGVLKSHDYVQGTTIPPFDEMIAQTMTTINNVVGEFDKKGSLGSDLSATLVNVRQLSGNLNELVASLKPYLTKSADNMTDITSELKVLIARADNISKSIENQEGTIGALISDPVMKEDIKSSITNLKEVTKDAKELLGKANKFKIFWDFDAYYDTSAKFMQNDIGLKIMSPNNYTYYRIALANIGNKNNEPKAEDYVDANLLDARMGIYNGYWDISAGLIRGAGGAEIGFTPFYGKEFLSNLTLRVSGSDFSRNRYVNGRDFTKGNIWYGADFKINKYLTFGGGIMDALETNHPYIRLNLKLEDKDISSFFGMATLAK